VTGRPINYGCPVNWGNPLNRGLVSWWLPLPNWSGGGKLFDLTKRYNGTLVNSPSWKTDPSGFRFLRFVSASSQRVDFATMPTLSGNFYISLAARGTSSGTQLVIGPNDFSWWLGFSSGNLSWNGAITTSGVSVNDGNWHHLTAYRIGGTLYLAVDGVVKGSGSVGTSFANGGVSIGSFGGGGYYFDGDITDVRYSTAAPPNPVLLYEQWKCGNLCTLNRIPSRVWSFATTGGGGGSYSLAMDAGTYSVTGSAVALKAARKLASAAGSYTQTGQAVALKAGRKLASASGSYTVTGSAVALKAARKIASASGSYSLTGSAVVLKAGRKLASAAGSYSVTGSAVGLKAGRKLAIAAGAYSLTGQDVTLTYSGASGSYTINIDSAAYSLTGQAVGLKAGRQLAVGSGTYTLTGSAVALPLGHALPMGVGSYLSTGSAVALRAARMIAELSGTYTLTGLDVTFTYTPAAVDLLDGLQAHYRLDGDLTDSSGNGRDLTGTGTYQTGLLGQELATGSGTRTPLGGLDGSALSISAWLSVPSDVDEGAGFVGFGAVSETVLIRTDNGAITFVVDGSVEHSENVDQDERHHVVLTYDGATARLYVDNSLAFTGSYTFTSGWETEDFSINTATADTSPIDEVSVYSRAINAAEVDDLYNSGFGYDPTNSGPVSRFTIAGTDRSRLTIAGTDRSRVTVPGTLRN